MRTAVAPECCAKAACFAAAVAAAAAAAQASALSQFQRLSQHFVQKRLCSAVVFLCVAPPAAAAHRELLPTSV
jgi:hypothetical protein